MSNPESKVKVEFNPNKMCDCKYPTEIQALGARGYCQVCHKEIYQGFRVGIDKPMTPEAKPVSTPREFWIAIRKSNNHAVCVLNEKPEQESEGYEDIKVIEKTPTVVKAVNRDHLFDKLLDVAKLYLAEYSKSQWNQVGGDAHQIELENLISEAKELSK